MLGGLVVAADGSTPHYRVGAVGARAIMLPLDVLVDQMTYLRAVRVHGHQVVGVLGRAAFADRRDWRRTVHDLAYVDTLLAQGLLDALVIGYEADDGWLGPAMADDPRVEARGGVASWVLSFAEWGELLARVADRFYGTLPLYLGGLASGHAEALDFLDLARLDGVVVHPWGARPDPSWPAGDWGSGFIGWRLDAIRQKLTEREPDGRLQLLVADLGLDKYRCGQGLVAEWYARTLSYLAQRGDVAAVFVAADSDRTADGYGLFRADESPEPAVLAIAQAYATLAHDSLAAPTPPPTDVEEVSDAAPWWDEQFSAAQIAYALGTCHQVENPYVLIRAIEAYWAEFGPWLTDVDLRDHLPTRLHLLATIAVDSGWTFLPTDERGGYAAYEAAYGLQTRTGRALGNRYVADGARFHGRGFHRLLGRAAYRTYGDLLGIELEREPEEALDPIVASGVLVAATAAANVPHLASLGQWELCRRAADPGLNSYREYLAVVEALSEQLTVPTETIEAETAALGAVLAMAALLVGVPFVWGGASSSGLDASGLVALAYEAVLGLSLPRHADALAEVGSPIDPAAARPGDLVLYAYYDPSQPGVTYPHVGLVTAQADLVLDARGGVGVGYHPHVQGAVRSYRRLGDVRAAVARSLEQSRQGDANGQQVVVEQEQQVIVEQEVVGQEQQQVIEQQEVVAEVGGDGDRGGRGPDGQGGGHGADGHGAEAAQRDADGPAPSPSGDAADAATLGPRRPTKRGRRTPARAGAGRPRRQPTPAGRPTERPGHGAATDQGQP